MGIQLYAEEDVREVKDITCPRIDTNFVLERYQVEQKKIKVVPTRGHVIFFLLYKQ